MASQSPDQHAPIREEDIQGLKYFRKLWPLLERLHEVGCQRDKAGNRQLFMDQYCSLVLLFMFNPCVRSLRALQQAAELKNVQRKLGCGRASLGSLSEATDVFDPQRLREIIADLADQIEPTRNVAQEHVRQLLVAVDGSVVETLSTIAAAAYLKTKNGDSCSAWRLHTHFDIDRSVPTRIDVTTATVRKSWAIALPSIEHRLGIPQLPYYLFRAMSLPSLRRHRESPCPPGQL
jgi:hypothetical protein